MAMYLRFQTDVACPTCGDQPKMMRPTIGGDSAGNPEGTARYHCPNYHAWIQPAELVEDTTWLLAMKARLHAMLRRSGKPSSSPS